MMEAVVKQSPLFFVFLIILWMDFFAWMSNVFPYFAIVFVSLAFNCLSTMQKIMHKILKSPLFVLPLQQFCI